MSIDINLMNIDVLRVRGNNFNYGKIGLRKLYGIRVHYFEMGVQYLPKNKPKISGRLLDKYSKCEKNRVKIPYVR